MNRSTLLFVVFNSIIYFFNLNVNWEVKLHSSRHRLRTLWPNYHFWLSDCFILYPFDYNCIVALCLWRRAGTEVQAAQRQRCGDAEKQSHKRGWWAPAHSDRQETGRYRLCAGEYKHTGDFSYSLLQVSAVSADISKLGCYHQMEWHTGFSSPRTPPTFKSKS